MDGAPRVITLELRLDGDLPTGRASTPDHRRRFAGWLRLIAAIQALAGDTPDLAGAREATNPPGGDEPCPR